jgi:hypothetical protein
MPPDLSAGSIPPSPTLYRVTHTHDHPTLLAGDLVRMVSAPKPMNERHLFRMSDRTLHSPYDRFTKYVHLIET